MSATPTPIGLTNVERWCEHRGLVMRDFPDPLIEYVASTGDLDRLERWLEDNTPRTLNIWED